MGSKRARGRDDEDNGFAAWGGYMAAKKAKLLDQFKSSSTLKRSDIFQGVAIHVNGYTTPSVDELKFIMASHGGVYHHYQDSGPTTHIIASNLPNVKIKNMGSIPIVKPEWITDSLTAGSLQDYRKYLLYTNQSRTQPTLKSTLTAADPKFLSEFYNNSRLHLISTLGAEFKQLVNQLREKSDGRFPGKEKLLNLGSNKSFSSSDSVVMHIDMDCFFVSVGLRNRPELKGKPVAVTHAKRNQAPSGREELVQKEVALLKEKYPERLSHFDSVDSSGSFSEIASCSYEARERGVRNGMLLGAAVRLCPDLCTIPYDFEGYRQVSKTLYHTIASYTLDIEAVSCDEMFVDVSSLLRDTGTGVEQWASHIRSEIMQATGCPCSTGFGANRLQARLATRKAKPAGQYYLKPEEVGWFMNEIPLAHLPGVGHATVTKLEAMGYKTCGELENAPVQRLQAEFGTKTGKILLEQVRGIDRKPLNFNHERKSVSADVNYGIRFENNEEALNFLLTLSQEVYQRLSDIGMRARGLTLKLLIRASDAPVETPKFLGCGVCDAINRSTTSNSLIADSATIFNEAKVLFQKVKAVPQDLRGVGIQLTKLEKVPPVNTVLSKFLQQGSGENSSKAKVVQNKTVARATGSGKKGKKSKKVAANSLVNYFKSAPDRSGQASTSKDIDLAILDELPEDIRKEVIKQYHLDTKPPTTQKQQQQIEQSVLDELPEDIRKEVIKQYQLDTKPPTPQKLQQQIEQSVLDELPEDIRNEVMREYNIKPLASTSTAKIKEPATDEAVPSTSTAKIKEPVTDEAVPSTSTAKIEEPAINEAVPSTSKASVNNRLEQDDRSERRIEQFSDLTWEELKEMFLVWLRVERKPKAVDVSMLAEYFKQMAIDRKIEQLEVLLRFLHRHISKLDACDWHEAYCEIVNTAQQGMVARYGATLAVSKKFACSLHNG